MTEGEDILAAVEAKRGYTLPYHRLFARHAPALLRDYDRFYESLTLAPRLLTPVQRETVWAGLLAAAREVHGFIHMRRATAAGMSHDDIARAAAIAAATEAVAVMTFAGSNWAAWTLPEALEARYLGLFEAAAAGRDAGRAQLTAAVAMAARRDRAGTVLHLARGFASGITAGEACEGLSYLLLPCGGNTLIEAVSFWEDAAKVGILPAPY